MAGVEIRNLDGPAGFPPQSQAGQRWTACGCGLSRGSQHTRSGDWMKCRLKKQVRRSGRPGRRSAIWSVGRRRKLDPHPTRPFPALLPRQRPPGTSCHLRRLAPACSRPSRSLTSTAVRGFAKYIPAAMGRSGSACPCGGLQSGQRRSNLPLSRHPRRFSSLKGNLT